MLAQAAEAPKCLDIREAHFCSRKWPVAHLCQPDFAAVCSTTEIDCPSSCRDLYVSSCACRAPSCDFEAPGSAIVKAKAACSPHLDTNRILLVITLGLVIAVLTVQLSHASRAATSASVDRPAEVTGQFATPGTDDVFGEYEFRPSTADDLDWMGLEYMFIYNGTMMGKYFVEGVEALLDGDIVLIHTAHMERTFVWTADVPDSVSEIRNQTAISKHRQLLSNPFTVLWRIVTCHCEDCKKLQENKKKSWCCRIRDTTGSHNNC